MNAASTKEKLNTKSSTEAELVAIDHSMAQVLWTRHFVSSEGTYDLPQQSTLKTRVQSYAEVPSSWTYDISLLQTRLKKNR